MDVVIKKTWEQIIHVHMTTKYFGIKAEEYAKDFKTYVQPFNELKNSLEHIIRAMSVEVGITDKGQEYVKNNLDKALGHGYRAVFDTADWLTITIRDRIIETLRPFNPEVISKAMPEYYSNIRPRIDAICNDIAGLRGRKDIENDNDFMIKEVNGYGKILDELLDIDKKIRNSVSAIIEISNAKRNEKVISGLIGFLSALVLSTITYFFKLKG